MTLPKRFWDKVTTSKTNFYEGTPCLEWTACTDIDGYGRFQLNGKSERAHRLSYEDKYGTIPKGLVINHMCRNRACQNRDEHLEVITRSENIQKGLAGFVAGLRNRLKTHCKQGHEFSKNNTRITPKGHCECKICKRIQYLQFMQRKNTLTLTCRD